MSNLLSLFKTADSAKVLVVHADKDIIVLIMALCLSAPVAGPALKLGQNNHKNSDPRIVSLKLNRYVLVCYKKLFKNTSITLSIFYLMT